MDTVTYPLGGYRATLGKCGISLKKAQLLADMVDMPKVSNRQVRFQRICIFKGCNPRFAAAVGKLSRRWEKYSSSSRRYSIYTLLSETIDDAWLDYIASLPDEYVAKGMCRNQILSLIAERDGFDNLQRSLVLIARHAASFQEREISQIANTSGVKLESTPY